MVSEMWLGHGGVSVLTILQFKLLSIFLCGEEQIDLLLCCHPSYLLWDVQLLHNTTQSSGSYQKPVTTASQLVETKLIRINLEADHSLVVDQNKNTNVICALREWSVAIWFNNLYMLHSNSLRRIRSHLKQSAESLNFSEF